MDNTGKVFVTGSSAGNGSSLDYVTIAYSSSGATLWTNRYNGMGNADDIAKAVAVDSDGNVFVTGRAEQLRRFRDDQVFERWRAAVDQLVQRPENKADQAHGIAVVNDGGVVVTGSSLDSDDTWDIATVKYSSTGAPLWTNRYGGVAGHDDVSQALAVDGLGNVFVTGTSWRTGSYEITTVAYTSAGVPMWTNFYTSPGDFYDSAHAVAVDGNGHVFVTSQNSGKLGGLSDNCIFPRGSTLWTNRYSVNSDDLSSPWPWMAVAMFLSQAIPRPERLLRLYDNCIFQCRGGLMDQSLQWDDHLRSYDQARSGAVDGRGNVYVTGYS